MLSVRSIIPVSPKLAICPIWELLAIKCRECLCQFIVISLSSPSFHPLTLVYIYILCLSIQCRAVEYFYIMNFICRDSSQFVWILSTKWQLGTFITCYMSHVSCNYKLIGQVTGFMKKCNMHFPPLGPSWNYCYTASHQACIELMGVREMMHNFTSYFLNILAPQQCILKNSGFYPQ